MSQYEPREVLDAYVAALEASGRSPIRDVGSLAHPKDIVKFVLQHCLRTITAADQQAFLKHAYLALAAFQPLSEPERAHVAQFNASLAQETGELSEERVADIAKASVPLHAVIANIRAESLVLAQELKSLLHTDAETPS